MKPNLNFNLHTKIDVFYENPNIRPNLYYWVRFNKNSEAEIDYIVSILGEIIPIEVKANTQGGMKSLWSFMKEKNKNKAIRCSLENYGIIKQMIDNNPVNVFICPIYDIGSFLYKGMNSSINDTFDNPQ